MDILGRKKKKKKTKQTQMLPVDSVAVGESRETARVCPLRV